ncbi:DUF1616 domain-containing protein [Haloarcula laminariae]|uniref:DUF1616 domain-containing protein n=1 Tax=Haloarcula laminariae TaxID=2961577 RepID=UPI0024061E08|nr:DUF1616 domain-containing protein [Halomicroarcula sp. FL173]
MQKSGVADRVLAVDLLAVVASVALVALVAFSPAGAVRPLAIAVGLPFVLFVPGYALVSAVFPRAGETALGPGTGTAWLARLGLSVIGSVVAVASVGGVLDFTVWGFGRTPVIAGLCLFTLVSTAVAWYRRRRLPVSVQAGADAAAVRARASQVVGGNAAGVVLTLVVVAAAAGAVGVVATESTEQGTVTEFYILGENESGELVAGNYPSTVTAGQPVTVGVGVGTTNGSGFDGRVVATIERVNVSGETARVTDSQRLDAFDVEVSGGERTVRRHTVRPSLLGERLRLTYRLYRTGADAPLRRVQLWLSVTPQ